MTPQQPLHPPQSSSPPRVLNRSSDFLAPARQHRHALHPRQTSRSQTRGPWCTRAGHCSGDHSRPCPLPSRQPCWRRTHARPIRLRATPGLHPSSMSAAHAITPATSSRHPLACKTRGGYATTPACHPRHPLPPANTCRGAPLPRFPDTPSRSQTRGWCM
jgi:hypothetical protein